MEIIQWCELCSKAPADGILEVIRKGDTQLSDMACCQDCVNKIPKSQWLENQRIGASHA